MHGPSSSSRAGGDKKTPLGRLIDDPVRKDCHGEAGPKIRLDKRIFFW